MIDNNINNGKPNFNKPNTYLKNVKIFFKYFFEVSI